MFLTHNDTATIRNILENRLNTLTRTRILDWRVRHNSECVRIGVLLNVDDLKLCVSGWFELPLVFEKRQLENEIDEIAEGVKEARRRAILTRALEGQEVMLAPDTLPGTGLRGHFLPKRIH